MNKINQIIRFIENGCAETVCLFLFLLILAFIIKNFILILLFCLLVLAIIEGIKVTKNYIKYKDETTEQREERLKKEEMIKKWRKEFH